MYVWNITLIFIIAKQVDHWFFNGLIHVSEICLWEDAVGFGGAFVVVGTIKPTLPSPQIPFPFLFLTINLKANPQLDWALFG